MDKYLKVDFFKKRGFDSKEEGITFIEETPELKRKFSEFSDDIEEYKNDKIMKYSKMMTKFDNEKSIFLTHAKQKRAEKRMEKELMKKNKMKEMLNNEIRMEMEIEMNEEEKQKLLKKYNPFCPEIDYALLGSIEELYSNLFKKMEDTGCVDKSNLVKIKENIDKGYKLIEKSVLKLQTM